MRTKDLIINDTDIIELFTKDCPGLGVKIYLTNDVEASNINKQNFTQESFQESGIWWYNLLDLGRYKIIAGYCDEVHWIRYDEVTAVIVHEMASRGKDKKTFINKNFKQLVTNNYLY